MSHRVSNDIHGDIHGGAVVGALVLGVGSGALLAAIMLASGQGALFALLAYLLTGTLVSGAVIAVPAVGATARAARRHVRRHAHV